MIVRTSAPDQRMVERNAGFGGDGEDIFFTYSFQWALILVKDDSGAISGTLCVTPICCKAAWLD